MFFFTISHRVYCKRVLVNLTRLIAQRIGSNLVSSGTWMIILSSERSWPPSAVCLSTYRGQQYRGWGDELQCEVLEEQIWSPLFSSILTQRGGKGEGLGDSVSLRTLDPGSHSAPCSSSPDRQTPLMGGEDRDTISWSTWVTKWQTVWVNHMALCLNTAHFVVPLLFCHWNLFIFEVRTKCLINY